MRIPIFSRMTAPSRSRKVVRASAARAVRGGEDEYYEAEPNMKLSHAFMVVLVLHIVAVGGIYAFNQIHAKKNAGLVAGISDKIAGVAKAESVPAVPPPPQRLPGDADEPLPSLGGSVTPAQQATVAPVAVVAPAVPMTATKAAVPKVESKPPAAAKTVAGKEAATKAAAGKAEAGAGTYKVAKGDNPYTIAKKFGVGAQEILTLNGIDDPKKLQIGQVLKVPHKAD